MNAKTLSLSDVSSFIGDQCAFDLAEITLPDDASPSVESVVGKGTFRVQKLEPGLTITASSFTAAGDIGGIAEFPLGLFVMIMIEGRRREVRVARHEAVELEPGIGIALRFNTLTHMEAVTPSGVLERMVCIQATPEWLSSSKLKDPLADMPVTVRRFSLDVGTQSLLEDVFVVSGDDAVDRLLAKSCASAVVAQSFKQDAGSYLEGITAPCYRQMVKVHDILRGEPFGDHSLASLSRRVGVSATTLKVNFPRVFGMPVLAYLRSARLDIAREALQEGRWSVAEAAYAIGFGHPSSFSAAYKKKYGITPRELSRRPLRLIS